MCVKDRWFDSDQLSRIALESRCLPQMIREMIIFEAVQGYIASPEAVEHKGTALIGHLSEPLKLNYMKANGFLSSEHFEAWLSIQVRLDQLKHDRFSHLLKTEFLARKSEFDRVWYSIIKVPADEEFMALELFMRLEDGEDFEALAEFSHGKEKQSGGRVGPIPLAHLPLEVQHIVWGATPRRAIEPMPIVESSGKEWLAIFRLDRLVQANFELVQGILLDQLFERWLAQELNNYLTTLKISNSQTTQKIKC